MGKREKRRKVIGVETDRLNCFFPISSIQAPKKIKQLRLTTYILERGGRVFPDRTAKNLMIGMIAAYQSFSD